MMSINGTEALAIVTFVIVFLGGFIYYIFRESAKLTGNLPATSKLHSKMAAALKNYQEGRYREALEQWPELIRDFERTGNIAGLVAVTTLTGHALEKLGDYEGAVRAYKSTMAVAHRGEYEESLEIAYRRYCFCQLRIGNPAEAGNALRELSEVYRREGNAGKAIETLVSLANTFRKQGYLEHAAKTYEEALELSTRLEHREGRAMVFHDQALFLRTMGKLSSALACAQEAAQIRLEGANLEKEPRGSTTTRLPQKSKKAESQAHMLSTTADFLRQLGRIEEARTHYRQALEIARSAGSHRFLGIVELGGSLIAWTSGEREEARLALQRAVQAAAADDTSDERRPVNAIVEASYAEQSGELALALGTLETTQRLFPTMKPNVESAFLNVKCRALARNGQLEEAAATLEKSNALAAKLRAPLYAAENARAGGVVAHYRGDHQEAAARLLQALVFFQAAGFKGETAITQKYLAAALAKTGKYAESGIAREEARRLYLELGDAKSAEELSTVS